VEAPDDETTQRTQTQVHRWLGRVVLVPIVMSAA
jgi:hypothetical protein